MLKISLKGARANANLTQKEVIEKLGISVGTLSNWENGLSFPDAQQIKMLCDLYGVSYDDINFLPNNPIKTDINGEQYGI